MPAPPSPAVPAGEWASNGSTPIGRCPGCCSTRSSAFERRALRDSDPPATAFRARCLSSPARREVQDLGPWSGSLQLRYVSPYPLIEDNSVRSNPSTITNLRIGYKFNETWSAHFDVLNLFNSDAHDIDYYYPSCLRTEVNTVASCTGPRPVDGINDIHFHPAEPRQFRFTVSARF